MSKSEFKLMDMSWSLKKDDGEINLHIEFKVEETEYDFTHAEAKKLHANLGSLLEQWPDCDTCDHKDTMCEPGWDTKTCAHYKGGEQNV